MPYELLMLQAPLASQQTILVPQPTALSRLDLVLTAKLISQSCSGIDPACETSGIAFQRSQVVPVGAQAYVAVGADGEECGSFHPQLGCRGGVEVPDGVTDVGAGGKSYSGFKQGRMFYMLLQGGVESR